MSEIVNYRKTWGFHFQIILQCELASIFLTFLELDASSSPCKTAKIDQVLKSTNSSSNSYTVWFIKNIRRYGPLSEPALGLVTSGDISDYIISKIMQGGWRILFFVTDYENVDQVLAL